MPHATKQSSSQKRPEHQKKHLPFFGTSEVHKTSAPFFQPASSGQFFTPNGINTIIQQKPETKTDATSQSKLEKDKLNVVGEQHLESGKRREQEIKYVKTVMGEQAGYWTESEFTAEGDTDFGDPKHLRLAFLLKRLRDFIIPRIYTSLELSIAEKKTNGGIRQLERLKTGMETALDDYLTLIQNENKIILKLINQKKYPLAGYIGQSEFVAWAAKLIDLIQSLIAGIKKTEDYLNLDDSKRDVSSLKKLAGSLNDTLFDIGYFASKSINQDLKGQQDFSGQRSRKMHEAANKTYQKPGVWKIGQVHVDDIKKEFKASDRQYGLMDRSEFTDILQE